MSGLRRKGKSVQMKVLVPEHIYLEFERVLTRNFTITPIYGMRSQILTHMILEWLERGNSSDSSLPSTIKEPT